MFQRHRLVSLRFVFSPTAARCDLHRVGIKAGGATAIARRINGLFCTFGAYLLLAGLFASVGTAQTLIRHNPMETVAKDSPSDPNVPSGAARAIARFDVVPYQIFSGTFEIGVVAFHIDGVQRVEFEYETLSGPRTVTEAGMRVNPRTGVCEYWTALNASDFADGAVTVKATAYPNSGLTRELSLELYANSRNTLAGRETLYVSLTGDDTTGAGSRARPFRSIRRALTAVAENVARYDGGTIILMDPGSYDMGGTRWPANNNTWITIRPDEGLRRSDVTIVAPTREIIRPNTRRLRFCNLSFDFSKVGHIYKEDAHWQWYDNCRWYQSEGSTATYPVHNWAVRNVGFNGLYVTNCLAEEMLYGFTGCNLVRGSHCRKITGDVFQMSRMVVNCTVDGVDGLALEHHTDLFQYWDQNENVIVYGVKAVNVAAAQNFFFGGVVGTYYRNCAFVNVVVQNVQDRRGPPFTQYQRVHDHVLFMHISNPGQLSGFRDDVDPPCTARNVKFVNCMLEGLSRGRWGSKGLPEGVTVESCHFLQGELHGTRPTTGRISILDGPGSRFIYEGPAATDVLGAGQTIPGFSHPNDGTSEHGAPNRGAFIFDVGVQEADPNAQ